MRSLVYQIDEKINLLVILFLFWGSFWLLNGGDKFLNGELLPNTESWSAKAALVTENGDVVYTLHPMEVVGLYGVNRDERMIKYFANIHLPRELALGTLYSIAVVELLLGMTFLSLLVWCLLPDDLKAKAPQLFNDRTVHRLAFKGSLLIFVFFSVGDTLFGDRTELWEHSTFIILCLITYDLWYRTDWFFIKRANQKKISQAAQRSIQASAYQKN